MPHRTTLTLEDDVAAMLRDAARRSGRPLHAVVNDALRAGLASQDAMSWPPFRVDARPMGLRPGLDLDCIPGVLGRLEGLEPR